MDKPNKIQRVVHHPNDTTTSVQPSNRQRQAVLLILDNTAHTSASCVMTLAFETMACAQVLLYELRSMNAPSPPAEPIQQIPRNLKFEDLIRCRQVLRSWCNPYLAPIARCVRGSSMGHGRHNKARPLDRSHLDQRLSVDTARRFIKDYSHTEHRDHESSGDGSWLSMARNVGRYLNVIMGSKGHWLAR